MEAITLDRFLTLLQSCSEITYSPQELYQLGVLEEIDLMDLFGPLPRGSAARILHLYLKKIRYEPDLEEWNRAGNLADLYDCRTCVQHIAQVVEKGIMEPDTLKTAQGDSLVFCSRKYVTREEAERICRRATQAFERIASAQPVSVPTKESRSRERTQEEALLAMSGEGRIREKSLLADVRPLVSYEQSHLTGAVHCPLSGILEGRFDGLLEQWEEVYFYCEEGYQARIAAAYLAEKGLAEPFYFCFLPLNNAISEQ